MKSRDSVLPALNSYRRVWLALVPTLLLGLAISLLPHFLAYYERGSWDWYADHDELELYMASAAQAYHERRWHAGDPLIAAQAPTMYSSMALIPGTLIARALRIGPGKINVVWRVISAVTIAAGFYFIALFFLGRPWLAAAVAAVLLTDGGIVFGKPVALQLKNFIEYLLHGVSPFLEGKPNLHPEWRMINPGLSLGALLFYLLALSFALARPEVKRRTVAAGMVFGLLFYVYFYYWTTAGLALLLLLATDRAKWKTYFAVGAIGLILGLPHLLYSRGLKAAVGVEWLQRTDKFLPIGHFSEILLPVAAIALLAACLCWTWRRQRDLWPLALHAAAALLLVNQQIVSGLQFENFHWSYAWGPLLSLLILVILAREITTPVFFASRAATFVFVGVLALHIGVGLFLRALEATRATETRSLLADLDAYRELKRVGGAQNGFVANAVMAGDPVFVKFAVIFDNIRPLDSYAGYVSPNISHAQWNERIALDAYAFGLPLADFVAEQRERLEGQPWGKWGRSEAEREALLKRRTDAFHAVVSDPATKFHEYGVRYIVRVRGASLASPLPKSWKERVGTDRWEVWENLDF